MSRNITLSLPDILYEPVRRIAQATHQPVEAVLLTALQASLPSLEGLAPAMVQELSELETLNDNVLRLVMLETVPPEQQHELESLLQRNQSDTLTTEERTRLSELQQAIEYVMLRKARAAVLLRFRGQRIPSLAELRELTLHAQ